MKTRLFLIVIFLTSARLWSQDIATNSKNTSVFSYYNSNKYSVEFNSKELGLTYGFRPDTIKYIGPFDSVQANVTKMQNWIVKFSMLNSMEIINLNDLKNLNPGFKVQLGYNRYVHSISGNFNGWTYSLGGSASFSMDNILLYDAMENIQKRKYPLSYAFGINSTLFPRSSKRKQLVSFSLNYSNTWNNESLLNFSELNSSIINSNVVATKNFIGKYGVLEKNISKMNVNISVPIDLDKQTRKEILSYLTIIPYASAYYVQNQKPAYYFGLYNNFLDKNVDFRQYSNSSSLGIGIDWGYINNKWTSANIFLRGTINFKNH
ncbi:MULTISPECIES: hypothetical protein [unclassified Chryseobacterium]|uniref:hypothetical protein n=1 Tax=unclassified Chryseobacterium TaxID=2593645 RepID=UPI000F50AE9B|nr:MULTISPECIES: hypothetical protein [unclassified Chryseobacterium]